MNGLLIINKPEGFTSFDCVAIVRRVSGERRTGHTGTLDPNATGVLPICIGSACRLIEFMDTASKTYAVSAKFGYTSDTLDTWGEVVNSDSKAFPSKVELIDAIHGFVGENDQIPPMYAAIKVNGKKLYQYAREGKTVEVKPRKVTIFNAELTDYDEATGEFKAVIECSRGTYVRSITRDLGEMFGCGCIMTGLERQSAAGYTLNDCLDIENVRSMSQEELEKHLLPFESAVSSLPVINLDSEQASLFDNGNPKFSDHLQSHLDEGQNAACFADGKLLGIARLQEGKLKAYKVFH